MAFKDARHVDDKMSWAVGMAVGVSCAVGIIFGVVPSRKAASLDPIEALNSD